MSSSFGSLYYGANTSQTVTACAAATGFQFEKDVPPTATQLRRMCAESSCIEEANYFMLSGRMNPTPEGTLNNYRILDAFTFPLIDFCYYLRTPGEPCPTDFLADLLSKLRDLVQACESKSGFSFRNVPPRAVYKLDTTVSGATNQTLLRPLCAVDECENLMKRIQVKPDVRSCPPFYFGNATGLYVEPSDYKQVISGFVDPYMWECDVWSRPRWNIPTAFRGIKTKYVALPGPLPGDETPAPSPVLSSQPTYVDDGSRGATPSDSGSRDVTPTIHSDLSSAPSVIKPTAGVTMPPTIVTKPTGMLSMAPSIESRGSWTTADTESSGSAGLEPKIGIVRKPPSAPATTTVTNSLAPSAEIDSSAASSIGKSNNTLLWGGVSSAGAVALFVALFVAYRRGRRISQSKNIDSYQSLSDRSSATTSLAATGASSPTMERVLASCVEIPLSQLKDLRILGGGGSGVVYLVRDRGSHRLLASKRVGRDQAATDAFLAEICLVSSLSHPRIVRLVGVAGLHKTELQALFEYMAGGDLRRYLDGLPSVDTAAWTPEKVQIAVDIADALAYLHSLDVAVVHRDLKSRNVFLSRKNRAKLGDFGVSRSASAGCSMTTGVGTGRWLAPEVINGGGDYGVASDVYSFGVLLSELDTHQMPFYDLVYLNGEPFTEFAVLELVATQGKTPSFGASCPRRILQLAHQCLSYEPVSRPSAVEVLATMRSIQHELLQTPSNI